MLKKLLKNSYRHVLEFTESARKQKIIIDEDKKILSQINSLENQSNLFKELSEKGFVLLPDFFSNKEIDEFTKDLEFNTKKRNCSVSNLVITEKSLIANFLSNKKIKDLLISYLGKNAKLDFIEINRLEHDTKIESVSENWHFDTVGRRIKIFCFLNSVDTISTELAPKTHKIFHKNFSTKKSRFSDTYMRKISNSLENIYPKKRSILIFDTNIIHKGNYRKVLEGSEEISFRDTIQLEFSNKDKSDRLFSMGIDSIGVRNIFFSKENNLDNYLIDKDYISEFNNKKIIFYDQRYSSY